MSKPFNLLFPEWQGYGAHQDVYHGAQHFCRHVGEKLTFDEVKVPEKEQLVEEGGIIGRSSLLKLLDQASSILNAANPASTFMIGGTCACEIAPISFLNNQYDNDLAVFWFDAHGDLNTPASSPSHRLHGMPLRALLGEGDTQLLRRIPKFLNTEQVALVGARDLDVSEQLFVENNRVPIFRPNQVSHTSELIDFAKSAGFTKAYVHFDLDVLEPDEFPHVLVSVPDGLRISNAIVGLRLIRENFDVVGCSIVEYCPKEGGGDEQLMQLMNEGMGIAI